MFRTRRSRPNTGADAPGEWANPPSIQPYLPRLLWLYQMGLMLYWVYDRSPGQATTKLLFDKTLRMILFTIKVAGVPLLRPLYRPAGELLKTIYGESPQ